jgi:hypothetical protein
MKENCAPPFLLKSLASRAGVAESDVLSAVAYQKQGMWCVDASHPAIIAIAEWSRSIFDSRGKSQKAATSGPGTELKKNLAGWPFRITASAACSCNARAREMDARGIDWCEANIDTIVGWLREEATKRGLPFVDMAGRLLVRRAIRNARKAAS